MFVALNQACASLAFLGAALAGLAWARAGQMAEPLVPAEAASSAPLHDVRNASASAFVR